MAQFVKAEKMVINLDNITHVKVVARRVDVYVIGNQHAVASLEGEDAEVILKRMDDLKA